MERDVNHLVDHLFRREAGRMVAGLTRIFGPAHLGLAEDVVQEALLQALRTWPFRGVPDNPAGWLVQVAKNRALDALRRDASLASKEEDIRTWAAALSSPGEQEMDDQLRLIFICCQSAVPPDTRVALTLKTVGGFGVPEIARAFLAKEATVAQRLVRAKHRLQQARPPFEVPPPRELPAALDSVLEVLYAMFNEGYSTHCGEELVRRDVCHEAIRLARLVTGHPALDTPKTHALAALLHLQGARLASRVDSEGNLLLLSEQDRSTWDREMIAAGFRHLDRSARGDELSVYHLEAGIAAAHAAAPSVEETNWPEILRLYDLLVDLKPSPVVALNRAVALAMVRGPEAGLAALAPIRLDDYYLLPATEGELHARAGHRHEAAEAFRRSLEMVCPEPVRRWLTERLHEVARQPPSARGRS
ncbi:MAG TPA: sigma-70 family RNA polymerase sigma factor [Thermoanaerobaculia bacterium]|nr:sigma-70 family RNA polymerase sigma factor [Thermoanaerobaculia bacterium]